MTIQQMETAWAQLAQVLEELRGLNDARVNTILNRYGVSSKEEAN